jgi:hypothetical protein
VFLGRDGGVASGESFSDGRMSSDFTLGGLIASMPLSSFSFLTLCQTSSKEFSGGLEDSTESTDDSPIATIGVVMSESSSFG